eukprot:TRINITY_DN122311_c0_g1_i1.p1 TRINITY_DN122311_c0_g1~~TRINITY_DN122311_c0_g1_i1.p1  ORF type:complete len:489 (+),score=136.42 TRINITY_DN122311_c0_g1_i1:34-1500(+)
MIARAARDGVVLIKCSPYQRPAMLFAIALGVAAVAAHTDQNLRGNSIGGHVLAVESSQGEQAAMDAVASRLLSQEQLEAWQRYEGKVPAVAAHQHQWHALQKAPIEATAAAAQQTSESAEEAPSTVATVQPRRVLFAIVAVVMLSMVFSAVRQALAAGGASQKYPSPLEQREHKQSQRVEQETCSPPPPTKMPERAYDVLRQAATSGKEETTDLSTFLEELSDHREEVDTDLEGPDSEPPRREEEDEAESSEGQRPEVVFAPAAESSQAVEQLPWQALRAELLLRGDSSPPQIHLIKESCSPCGSSKSSTTGPVDQSTSGETEDAIASLLEDASGYAESEAPTTSEGQPMTEVEHTPRGGPSESGAQEQELPEEEAAEEAAEEADSEAREGGGEEEDIIDMPSQPEGNMSDGLSTPALSDHEADEFTCDAEPQAQAQSQVLLAAAGGLEEHSERWTPELREKLSRRRALLDQEGGRRTRKSKKAATAA